MSSLCQVHPAVSEAHRSVLALGIFKIQLQMAQEKAQIHWSAFWRKKCLSGTEANNSQPIYTVAIVLARKKKEKGRERDKINFSSDVTSAK